MKWPNNVVFWSDNYRVIHTGTIEGRLDIDCVGIVLNREVKFRVKGCNKVVELF